MKGANPAHALDATPVSRLRAAGALLIGKANMFEIDTSPTGNNPIHGFARNPYPGDRMSLGGASPLTMFQTQTLQLRSEHARHQNDAA